MSDNETNNIFSLAQSIDTNETKVKVMYTTPRNKEVSRDKKGKDEKEQADIRLIVGVYQDSSTVKNGLNNQNAGHALPK